MGSTRSEADSLRRKRDRDERTWLGRPLRVEISRPERLRGHRDVILMNVLERSMERLAEKRTLFEEFAAYCDDTPPTALRAVLALKLPCVLRRCPTSALLAESL